MDESNNNGDNRKMDTRPYKTGLGHRIRQGKNSRPDNHSNKETESPKHLQGMHNILSFSNFTFLDNFCKFIKKLFGVIIIYNERIVFAPVRCFYNILQHISSAAGSRTHYDGFFVFKSNGKLIERSHAPASNNDGVRRSRQEKVPARIPKTRINNEIHIIEGELVEFNMFTF